MKKVIRFLNKKLFWFVYKFTPIYMLPFPSSVCIEASTRCNLKCPHCPTGQGQKTLSKGFLKFEDFKSFVDKYDCFIERIQLSNYGEIFLNGDIFEIIKYAEDKGIKTSADSNLNYFNEAMAEDLIKAGMTTLTVSIDGMTNESYSQYRINGNFDKVITNIENINKFKKKYNSKKPELIWQFIIFDHNKHEIHKAEEMAKKLNMLFCVKQDWGPYFPQNADAYKKSCETNVDFCYSLWHSPVINYNGNMLGCCTLFDERYHLGNVFKEGFANVYNGNRMRTARKMVLGKTKKIDNSIYCSQCAHNKNLYKK